MSDVNPNPNPNPTPDVDAAGGSSPPARPPPTTADIPLGTDTNDSPPITDIPLDDDDDTSPPAPPPAPLSVPPTPSFPEPLTPSRVGFIPLITVVGFHHARGPEVESWFGVEEGFDPAAEYGWTLLPFMALSDGAHATEEDFSYFTLLRPETPSAPATSLFGISCTRQLDSSQLLNRPADVTRSTVQKAVVVIADNPQAFGMLRERLSIVTRAWFAQREFSDVDILKGLQESLADEKRRGLMGREDEDANLGMSLRELVHEFKWQALVLLKACLLQPKMLFFGSRCDRLCMLQFSLISLIPNLIRNLQDCADPELNAYEKNLKPPTSLRTSDRQSLLQYMGLPLQIFGKGSLFGPYTPLQQLDILADFGTKSYIVGSTNSLLLQQRDRYSDILVNLDDNSISITSPSLRSALSLTASDRRWIDYLAAEVNETWDETDPSRPTTMRYVGSEEFIRLQFEEYILSLLSSVRYHQYITARANSPADTGLLLPHVEGDPSLDFGAEWVEAWKGTENYRIWNGTADSHLFDIVDPRHPCAGGLTMEDVQRRIAEQVRELHLDERLAQGREALGRNLAFGKEKAGTVLNKLYADMESFREAQRKRNEEAAAAAASRKGADNGEPLSPSGSFGGVDLNKAQQTVSSVGARAGAYVSSWASWAGEKRKGGFGSGWGLGGGKGGKGSAKEASGLMGTRGMGGSTAGEEIWGGAGEEGYSSLRDKRASGSSAGTYDLRAEDALVTGEGFVAVEKPGDYSESQLPTPRGGINALSHSKHYALYSQTTSQPAIPTTPEKFPLIQDDNCTEHAMLPGGHKRTSNGERND